MPADKTRPKWLSATTHYEGQPMALRVRPAVDSDENRARYPHVALVSHELAEVTDNGLPEANYNESLAEFDQDVHRFVERDADGLMVLVETFCGKRNYYAYVADDARVEARVEELKAKYPQHSLSARGGEDAEWALYSEYRERFGW